MRKVGLEEMKRIQLEILDDVDRFCRETGLRYSLCGGTLLGAVRHKGYIPWDDDIDILMPREDYETFIRTYRSDKNTVLDLRKEGTTVEVVVKVSRNGTWMTDQTLGRTLWGINIDIFPVDVKKFCPTRHEDKVPHMGWNLLEVKNERMLNEPFSLCTDQTYVYFVHSFYVPVCDFTTAVTNYIQPFSAALHRDNFYATQFHPEKSGAVGEEILRKFLENT